MKLDKLLYGSKDPYNLIGGGLSFAGQAYNSFTNNYDVNSLSADAGVSYGSINGQNYAIQNKIDSSAAMSELNSRGFTNTLSDVASGFATGGILGGAVGLVTGIGGWLSGNSKAKKAIAEQHANATRTTDVNRNIAMTSGMLQDFYNTYGDYANKPLHAAYGLDPKDNSQTAWGKGGETMYDSQQQDGAIIPGDPNKDNTPVHTSPDTTIYTKEYGFAEASIPSILAIKDANMKEAGINRHIQQIKGESARNVAKNVAAPLIAELDQQRDKANENLNKLSDMQHMYREYGLLPDNNGQIYPHAAFGIEQWAPYSMYMRDPSRYALKPKVDEISPELLLAGNNTLPLFKMRSIGDITADLFQNQIETTNKPVDNNVKDRDERDLGNKNNWFGMDAANNIAGITGGLLALGRYFSAKRLKVHRPNTYMPNTLAQRSYNELAKLRINDIPIIQSINNDAAAARYRILNSGGLSGAQKYLGNIATYANALKARADAYTDIQSQNNAYRAAEANARLEGGARDTSNQIQTKQWDENQYAIGHGAKEKELSQSAADASKVLYSWLKTRGQTRMQDYMMDLWAQDLRNRRNDLGIG